MKSIRILLIALSFLFVTSSLLYADTFPGTNGKIVFDSDLSGDNEIYTMNSDGSGLTNISNTVGIYYYPRWSPDGTKIVFVSDRDGNNEVYTMNADGSSQTRLTTNSARDDTASWSPDGTKIAFTTNRDGNYEIYTMQADGSSQTRLTNNAATEYNPSWSPDGIKIVFTSNRDGNVEIYAMNANGSSQTRLTNNATDDYNPSWSPNGSKIVFQATRDATWQIYTMDVDGTNQSNISNNSDYDFHPFWAPDETQIVYTSYKGDGYEIYKMNPDGSNQTLIHKMTGIYDEFPAWQSLPIIATPAPTTIPSARSNSDTNHFQSLEAPRCNDEKPASAPYLYQADVTNTKAVLQINPAGGSYNKYFIAYGTRWDGDEEYGVEFSQEHSTGALNYTINGLSPNTVYYFKTRAGNGCMPGEWSNNFKIKTTGDKETSKTFTTFTNWIMNKFNQWIVKF
ncbi:MAG: DUF5050 domain-containing protein [Patescibacteria group bacterium]